MLRLSLIRLPMIVIAVTSLSACALLEPRDGPPAPVVQLEPPSQKKSARLRSAATRPAASDAGAERVSAARPVAAAAPKTKVYTYRDSNGAAAETAGAEDAAEVPESAPETAPAPPPPPPVAAAAAPAGSSPRSAPVTVATAQTRTPSVVLPKTKPAAVSPAAAPAALVVPASPAAPKPAPAAAPVVVAKVEPPPPPAPKPKPAPPPPPPAPPLAAPPLPPAAQALASQAEQQRKTGDFTGAAASLERSLRIAPREPYLWNRLARVRMEQGQAHQAGNLAARANDLSNQNAAVKQDNWRIIAHSKRYAGDEDAAAAAERRAGNN